MSKRDTPRFIYTEYRILLNQTTHHMHSLKLHIFKKTTTNLDHIFLKSLKWAYVKMLSSINDPSNVLMHT